MARSGRRNSAVMARLLPWLSIALVVIGLDQASKWWVLRDIAPGARIVVLDDWFDLTLVFNKGAAFSFLASSSGWQRWFFIGIGFAATAYLIWILARHGGQWVFSLALALILGGALGNVIDRIWHARVVDFLLLHWREIFFWPAFNFADSAITLGAVLLIIDELRRVTRSR